jgi:hypothetical protein
MVLAMLQHAHKRGDRTHLHASEPAGSWTQLAAQHCEKVACVALIHTRWLAAVGRMYIHLSITITALAP